MKFYTDRANYGLLERENLWGLVEAMSETLGNRAKFTKDAADDELEARMAEVLTVLGITVPPQV